MFEDTKGTIRSRKSKNDRQHNDQKTKDKRTNNDIQNIKRTPLKSGGELKYSGTVPAPHVYKIESNSIHSILSCLTFTCTFL